MEGDRVTKGQVLAVLQPDELREERAFYEYSAAGLGSQVRESEAALRLAGTADARPDRAGGSRRSPQRVAAGGRQRRARERAHHAGAHAADVEGRHRHRRAARSGDHDTRSREVARGGARQANRRAESRRRARARERGTDRDQAEPALRPAPAAAGGHRAAREGRCASRLHRDPLPDRRHRRRARRASGRSGHARPARGDGDQSGQPLGAGGRRGNLHRAREARRHC